MDRTARTVAVGGSLILAALVAAPLAAQDAGFGKSVWVSQANCSDCHGWMGDGNNEDPRSPRGANLRETKLTAEQIAEVVLCGRPGTTMPFFDPRAYTDKRCYGVDRAALGDQVPDNGGVALTRRHADGLAAFILAEFAGKGAPTQASCAAILGASATCARYAKGN